MHTPACVQRLLDAGAVLLGKTNLDQFATGLVGTRSPYGAVPNSFDARYVSGGSSSGSASVVARGLVAFALGTDTAGSGRVPAGFNNIVGCKPTPGLVGARGMVPACATLDTVSVFALTVADAARVLALIEGGDEANVVAPAPPGPSVFPSALRVGVPQSPGLDGSLGYVVAFAQQLDRVAHVGGRTIPVDMSVLHDVAALLYDGPWVAERYVVVRKLLERQPQAIDPVVRRVIEHARGIDAAKAFEGRYRLAALARTANALWDTIDVLMVPTAPTLPTLSAVAEEPLLRNSELGRFTNFVNLLGWSALAVPAGDHAARSAVRRDLHRTRRARRGTGCAWARCGRPCSTCRSVRTSHRRCRTSCSSTCCRAARPRWRSRWWARTSRASHCTASSSSGVRAAWRARAPRRATGCMRCRTPRRPSPGSCAWRTTRAHAIEVEVYDMPAQHVGSFLALVPPPLGLGSIELEDGRWVKGFICEPHALRGARDISAFGGWRAYLQSERPQG